MGLYSLLQYTRVLILDRSVQKYILTQAMLQAMLKANS